MQGTASNIPTLDDMSGTFKANPTIILIKQYAQRSLDIQN